MDPLIPLERLIAKYIVFMFLTAGRIRLINMLGHFSAMAFLWDDRDVFVIADSRGEIT